MAWGARTLISTQVGFDITPEQMANDLAIMKAALPSKKTLVYGVLNQDSDQDKTTVCSGSSRLLRSSRRSTQPTDDSTIPFVSTE